MEFIRFIFSDFWHFVGALIILVAIVDGIFVNLFRMILGIVNRKKKERVIANGLQDLGIEFLKEYVNATPAERTQFSKRISEMALTSDELMKVVKTLGEVAKEDYEPVEGDDDRVRKELIDYLSNPTETKVVSVVKINEWLDWVKKQGEQKQEKNQIVESTIEWLRSHTAMSEYEYELMRKKLED